METIRDQFALTLRERRHLAGISQRELALRCGLHRSEISLLEQCKRSPRLDTVVIIARALRLDSPAELLAEISLR